ncbi:MAG: alanine racemase, partial [Alphaproteobacteria bacterium]|nr:alanine racemase [Alphaproteobacteria bacterium]
RRAGALLTIDLGAIVANWRGLVSRLAPGAACAAVVKADAYGLGAARVAPALLAAGCRHFFVATLDEGIALRPLLPGADLFVLNGPPPGCESDFAANGLIPVLNDRGQVERWPGGPCALHVDTGMNRLGIAVADFARVVEARPNLAPALVMSHLACADEDSPMNEAQRQAFASAAARLPGVPASLAASSGMFLGSGYHFDLVRPGAALYGVNPRPGQPNPMAQVVRLQGKILQLRDVDSPMTVGYGATHRVTRRCRLATVAIGYADGYPRSLSNRGFGVIGEWRVPIVGRVSMDLTIFDITEVPEALAAPGSLVELIGADLTVDDVAEAAGTIGYEILTRLGRRHHRVHVTGS